MGPSNPRSGGRRSNSNKCETSREITTFLKAARCCLTTLSVQTFKQKLQAFVSKNLYLICVFEDMTDEQKNRIKEALKKAQSDSTNVCPNVDFFFEQ